MAGYLIFYIINITHKNIFLLWDMSGLSQVFNADDISIFWLVISEIIGVQMPSVRSELN